MLSTPEGLKRFVTIKDSPYHGLNLCLGVLSEMHMNPAEEIFEPLAWLASRKKIFNIHFRNIKGNRLHFREGAPDEGEADFTRAVLVLAQNGYDGHITPDHNVAREGRQHGRPGLHGVRLRLHRRIDQGRGETAEQLAGVRTPAVGMSSGPGRPRVGRHGRGSKR